METRTRTDAQPFGLSAKRRRVVGTALGAFGLAAISLLGKVAELWALPADLWAIAVSLWQIGTTNVEWVVVVGSLLLIVISWAPDRVLERVTWRNLRAWWHARREGTQGYPELAIIRSADETASLLWRADQLLDRVPGAGVDKEYWLQAKVWVEDLWSLIQSDTYHRHWELNPHQTLGDQPTAALKVAQIVQSGRRYLLDRQRFKRGETLQQISEIRRLITEADEVAEGGVKPDFWEIEIAGLQPQFPGLFDGACYGSARHMDDVQLHDYVAKCKERLSIALLSLEKVL